MPIIISIQFDLQLKILFENEQEIHFPTIVIIICVLIIETRLNKS